MHVHAGNVFLLITTSSFMSLTAFNSIPIGMELYLFKQTFEIQMFVLVLPLTGGLKIMLQEIKND